MLKIEYLEETQDVYDLTVPETNCFFANDILVHNCGEISLSICGAFCVIADVVPFHANTLDEAEEAFRIATRALIRVNLMDSIYNKEVKRTNRIGVGITGIHEFAWKFFKLGFKDLVDEEKSKDFWLTLNRFNQAIRDEATKYSLELGVNIPHTMTTIKPAGCLDPSTIIKTDLGNKTLQEIFLEQDIVIEDYENLSNLWFDLKTPLNVYDMNNNIQPITKLYINGKSRTMKVEFEDGLIVNVTPNHKFLTEERGWVRADELDGSETFKKMKLKRKPSYNETEMVTVDISVAETNSYQLSNDVVVHNTTSKLFGLSEGWHLPSMSWYMRWVQFRDDDPLIKKYETLGYPTRKLQTYDGTVIVGFPTEPILASLGLGDKLVTAGEASPEDQYKWISLGEKYFIEGIDDDGNINDELVGNQISYTLKYKPHEVNFQKFTDLLKHYQPLIRCCSVMPQVDMVSYEYQPEEPITKAQYECAMSSLQRFDNSKVNKISEDIGVDHIECAGGICPVDFKDVK